MNPIEITSNANDLCDQFTNAWLAKRLGISHPTLKKRLGDGEWTLAQAAVISELHRRAELLKEKKENLGL